MCKLEVDVVIFLNFFFYNRYVDDCCIKRKVNVLDIFFENFNSYYLNIKFIVEENLDYFLDIVFIY